MELIILLAFFLGFYIAGMARKINKDRKMKVIPAGIKDNSLLHSIVELIALAGGIYLVLIMLIEFLAIMGLENIMFLGLAFDPIAAIAKIIALLHPFYERLRYGKSWS